MRAVFGVKTGVVVRPCDAGMGKGGSPCGLARFRAGRWVGLLAVGGVHREGFNAPDGDIRLGRDRVCDELDDVLGPQAVARWHCRRRIGLRADAAR